MKKILTGLVVVFSLFVITGVKITHADDGPTVSTYAASNITKTSALIGGTVTNIGSSAITARGECLGTSTTNMTCYPAVDANSLNTTYPFYHNTNGGLGLTLLPGTTYYYKAWARNNYRGSPHVRYGSTLSFKTNSDPVLATITLSPSYTINRTSIAGITSQVTTIGSSSLTERALCYSTSNSFWPNGSESTLDNKSYGGNVTKCVKYTGSAGSTSPFVMDISGLTAGTTYYLRAYAINSDRSFGYIDTSLTTPRYPRLSVGASNGSGGTTLFSGVSSSSATVYASVDVSGGGDITDRGFCYGKNPNSSFAYSSNSTDYFCVSVGSGMGDYSLAATGLDDSTNYYFKPYAVNNYGDVGYAISASNGIIGIKTLAKTPLTSISIDKTSPKVGDTITSTLLPSGATATYKWQTFSTSSGTYLDIPGATGSSYKVTAGEVNKYIKVIATGSGNYTGEVSTSSASQVSYNSTPTSDLTPRIAFWAGKVNQHVDLVSKVWSTDSDGVSGYNNKSDDWNGKELEYCKKFYPNTISTKIYKSEAIANWKDRDNVNSYINTVNSLECVATIPLTSISIDKTSPKVGDTITSTLLPSGATATYKWAWVESGKTPVYISNATSSSYTLFSSDQGKYVAVISTGSGNYTGEVTASTASKVVSLPSGSLTVSGCSIPIGQSTCSAAINSWSITNPVSGANTAITTNYPAQNTTVAGTTTATGSNKTHTIPYGNNVFFLYHNMTKLNESTATASCISGSTWDTAGKICKGESTILPGSLTVSGCSIPIGQSTCSAAINSWSITNPVSGANTAITTNYPAQNTTVAGTTTATGSNKTHTIPYGNNVFFLYHNMTKLNESTATASCISGSWDGNVCKDSNSVTGEIRAVDCIIPNNSNACNVDISWSTVNPITNILSEVTTNPSILIKESNSGSNEKYLVSYGTRTFYLYHNDVKLGEAIGRASCSSDSNWNNGACRKKFDSEWSEWSPVNNICDYTYEQTRTCIGSGCVGDSKRTVTNICKDCPACPVDCNSCPSFINKLPIFKEN